MKDEATISLKVGDVETPHIPLSTVKQALKQTSTPKDPDTKQMFNDRESGVDAYAGIAANQLKAFVERIERLEEEKKCIADDIKDVYAEAKGNGYDVKIMRKVVTLRKKQPHEREEEEAVLDLYMHALGMTGDAS